jgi:acetoacetyl-CoA synthetase
MPSRDLQAPLWEPNTEDAERVEMTRFMRWAGERRGRPFTDYSELWRWSVDDLEDFWASIWEFCGVRASRPYERVLDSRRMPGARWFEGAELNYAENMLAGTLPMHGRRPISDRSSAVALLHASELRPLEEITWGELSAQVAAAAGGLRALGVRRGDRVVAYMPNIPETIVAFLAVASIGAIWSSAAPEFGARSVIDRFAQIEPRVLLAVDGYRHGGRDFDRTAVVESILEELPTVEHLVLLSYLHDGAEPSEGGRGMEAGARPLPAPGGPDGPGRLTWGERRARSSASSRSPSTTPCGCSTHPAPPACPRRSFRATAGS